MISGKNNVSVVSNVSGKHANTYYKGITYDHVTITI